MRIFWIGTTAHISPQTALMKYSNKTAIMQPEKDDYSYLRILTKEVF